MDKKPRSPRASAEARNDGALIRHALMIAGIVVAALLIWKLNHILLLLFGAHARNGERLGAGGASYIHSDSLV